MEPASIEERMENVQIEEEDENNLAEQQKKAKFQLTWQNLDKVQPAQKVVMCYVGAPQAMFRILFDDQLEDIAWAEVLTEGKQKPETIVQVKKASDFLLLFVHKSMEPYHMADMFAGLKSKLGGATVISLSAVYKTTYEAAHG